MALQDMLQNLGGFQSLAANAQRMQQAEQQQMQNKEASDLLRTFYKSQQDGKPDYDSLNEAILRSPELAQNVLSGIGIQDKQKQQQNTMQQQQAASDVVTLYQSLGNKDLFNSAAAKRVNEIMSRGGAPKDTLELVRIYNEQGPESAALALKQVGAAMINQGYIKQPELIGFGTGQEPMSAYQQASTDLRRQELEDRKQQRIEETKTKALEAKLAKERDELERQKIQAQIDETKAQAEKRKADSVKASQERGAEAEAASFSIDNMLNTIKRIRETPNDVRRAAHGTVDSILPTIQQSVADYEDLVETLGSQAFLSQIPVIKGTGGLSNTEGEKIQAGFQNFKLRQGVQRLDENLNFAEQMLKQAKNNIAKKYGKSEESGFIPVGEFKVRVKGAQ